MSFPPLPVGLLIRPLALADLPGLLDVQRSCYGGGYVESAEVFAQRIACPTQCSLVLEVQGLTCGHGDAVVLTDVSFSLQAGRSLALLGRNGTGKTT